MKTAYNQLKLGNRLGLFEYKSLEDFYGMVLNALRAEYADGKIDYMRFLMDWTRLTGSEIDMIMSEIYDYIDMSPTVMDSNVVVLNWKDHVESRIKLAHLMAVLCYCVNHCDCFDAQAFDLAFTRIFCTRP